MKKKLVTILYLLIVSFLPAQSILSPHTTLVSGYHEKVSGVDFRYHSSIQTAKESMLIRATDGNSSMVWKTDITPVSPQTDSISFVWLAGIGSSPGLASFDLKVNGEKRFTIWADATNEWKLRADDGSTLLFSKDMIDQHGDRFGFMILTMATHKLEMGKAVHLEMTGGKFDRTSWYMTFKFPLKNGINLKSYPAIVSLNGKKHQMGIAGVLHFGKPEIARLFIDKKLVDESIVSFGYNHINIVLPVVDKSTSLDYRLELEGKTYTGKVELKPARQWEVNFVQHSHTDIGYTRPQNEILGEHLRFIDYALDYCDITDDYPEEAKFRWTCEAAWAVDEYLRSRPRSQVERLLQRIREDRIEITGMYFNFDELPDEQILAASLKPLKKFRESGIAVKTAMQNDVNGIGWCLADYFHDLGVRYLNMGTHGHRALICFDKPTLFWWESPSGKRMLAYRGEHYMIGNTVFKVQSGDFNLFEEAVLTYLMELEEKGYEYDLISLQHSGFVTDNSPPSTFMSEAIRKWNEKYEWPKLRTATATQFFEEMELRHGKEFEVIRGAWPDWWTDGFGASAREVTATRNAQTNLIAGVAGMAMAALQGAKLPDKFSDRIALTNEALLFYTEHTVGYHASVREPFHKYSMQQRSLKESYAWEASRRAGMLAEETLGLLQSFINRENEPSLVVFNTLNHDRSGLIRIYIDHQTIPRYSTFTISDQNGNPMKAQAGERHSDGTYWKLWAEDIPAFGYKKYRINVESDHSMKQNTSEAGILDVFENEWYKLEIDLERGSITGLYDKELNLELLDKNAEWLFGEFIYELLDNRQQMESFYLDNFTRQTPENISLESYQENDIWNTIRFRASTPAVNSAGGLIFEIRLFNVSKRLDLYWEIDKKLVTEPEGIYLAFPVHLENGQLAFEVQGGEVRAGIDQIPGSSNDWNTVQNYARLYNDDAQIIFSSCQSPLMQFGGINTGRYEAGAQPATSHIYGWPMNNYWTTNFNAYQLGGHTFLYSFTSKKGNEMPDAVSFGHGHRIPFLARILPGGGKGDIKWEGSLVTGWPENVILISATPEQDGRSAVFHLRETGGRASNIALNHGITGRALRLEAVDATGMIISSGTNEIKPFESRFFRVWF
jgi:hypothetical protein